MSQKACTSIPAALFNIQGLSDRKSNYKHHRKCEISSFSNHSREQERLVSVCFVVCSNNEVINTQSTLLKVRI